MKVTITKKKHGYKVENEKGIIRYSNEQNLERVKRELALLEEEPGEIRITL